MSFLSTPPLFAVTRPLSQAVDLLELTDPSAPLAWLRGDRGAVGIGEALRLEFTGATRFQDAAAAWRDVAAAATIDDPVALPGSGLVAFGTFAFADTSSTVSTVIVPEILVAQHRGQWWITRVSREAPGAADPELPQSTPAGEWPGVSFADLTDFTADSVRKYLCGVSDATARIANGTLEKIVIARQIDAALPASADLRVPIRRLAERYLDCWTYAVDGIIGASPETLIRSTGGAVSARVLAGTRGRYPDDAARDERERDELLTSSKEQHEHVFAVQSVVTALSPHVEGLRVSEEPFALQLPNVWHLATDLGASLRASASALSIVEALHPTAAVAGTPTREAIASIDEIEPFDRGRYSGAVGWMDHNGDGEWVIALRCAQVSEASGAELRVIATAGGGIVDGSDPAGELRETVSKFKPVSEAFAR